IESATSQDHWDSVGKRATRRLSPERVNMDDVQNQLDERRIAIDQVGVADLRCPIVVLDRQFQKQQTVATLAMSVNLPHHFKGTHMSRFVEVLNDHRGEV